MTSKGHRRDGGKVRSKYISWTPIAMPHSRFLWMAHCPALSASRPIPHALGSDVRAFPASWSGEYPWRHDRIVTSGTASWQHHPLWWKWKDLSIVSLRNLTCLVLVINLWTALPAKGFFYGCSKNRFLEEKVFWCFPEQQLCPFGVVVCHHSPLKPNICLH